MSWTWSSLIVDKWQDERFKEPMLVGTGAYAWVYQCIDNETDTFVAVKYIQFPRREEGVPRRILNEIAALYSLNHPNIVRPIFVRMEAKCVKIAMEYMNSDLARYLRCNAQPRPNEIKSFMFQILQGLSHIHSQGIVHRDVKPDNMLLDLHSKTIKIADFAHIRRIHDPATVNKITSIPYNPPEILLSTLELTTAADIWSLGCIFAEMVKGSRLFPGKFDFVILTKIIKLLGAPNEQAWPGVTHACLEVLGEDPEEDPTAALPPRESDLAQLFPVLEPDALTLLTRMLCFLPSERISAADALQHPYFHGLQQNQ